MIHFEDGQVRITTKRIATGIATYSVSSVAGVRLVSIRGGRWLFFVGAFAILTVLPYAGCAYTCVASGATTVPAQVMAMFAGPGAVLILLYYLLPPWWVVMLDTGGGEAAIVKSKNRAWSEQVAHAIEDAMEATEEKPPKKRRVQSSGQ